MGLKREKVLQKSQSNQPSAKKRQQKMATLREDPVVVKKSERAMLMTVTKKNPRTSPNLRKNPRKNLNPKRRFMLNLKKVPRNRRKSHQRRSKRSKSLPIHQS